MKTRYSKKTGNFYPLDTDYQNLPDDIQEVDLADYQAAMSRPDGSTFTFDDAGKLIISAASPETKEDTLIRALAGVRAQRSPILDALNGIASRAARRSDVNTAEAADAAADMLLDITSLPALLNATTYEEMKDIVLSRYKEIANSAPVTVQIAFREVFAS